MSEDKNKRMLEKKGEESLEKFSKYKESLEKSSEYKKLLKELSEYKSNESLEDENKELLLDKEIDDNEDEEIEDKLLKD